MPQWTKGRLVTAIFAIGLVGAAVLVSPSALADPDPDPAMMDEAAKTIRRELRKLSYKQVAG